MATKRQLPRISVISDDYAILTTSTNDIRPVTSYSRSSSLSRWLFEIMTTSIFRFRPIDFSPHGHFAPWTFRTCVVVSPHLGESPHGRFAPRPWGETSMGELLMGQNAYSAGRNVHGANRTWGETSIHGPKCPWVELELCVGEKS